MTTSTNGQICYGMLFEEDYSFPWDASPWDGDIEEWWLSVHGYKELFQLYDNEGEYFNIIPSESKIKEYYDHKRKFKKTIPAITVKLVNYCQSDYPMYIIAITGSCITARRGDPAPFDPSKLQVTKENVEKLKEFLKNYLAINDPILKWYLSSYWG